jgi:hypothetical protein
VADITQFTEREALETASRALGRVLRDDVRGMTRLSIDEIAAMSWALIGLGLIPTPPGETPPETLVHSAPKEARNGQ